MTVTVFVCVCVFLFSYLPMLRRWSAGEMFLPPGTTYLPTLVAYSSFVTSPPFRSLPLSVLTIGTFVAQKFYESIGYTIGATIGLCLAAPNRPVLTLIGDGAFQVCICVCGCGCDSALTLYRRRARTYRR